MLFRSPSRNPQRTCASTGSICRRPATADTCCGSDPNDSASTRPTRLTAMPTTFFTRMYDVADEECRAYADHQSGRRSEEHTSELQSLMRISYAVFCLKKQKQQLLTYKRPHW